MGNKIVTLGDERWEFDPEQLMLSDLFAIKAASGLDGVGFEHGLNRADPAAYQALIWLLRRRAGEQVAIGSIDFPVSALRLEDAPTAVEEEPENPTETGSEPVGTATSASSPSTAT